MSGATATKIALVGVPVDCGGGQPGCVMGPDALRTAGLLDALRDLGRSVEDVADVAPRVEEARAHPNPSIHDLALSASWIAAIRDVAAEAVGEDRIPIFLGGDHLMAAGTVTGVARAAEEIGRPQFVLWLDAHPDLHDLDSTTSGNLHGTPVAYFTGRADFTPYYPAPAATVAPSRVCMMGLRSVDGRERRILGDGAFDVWDMRAIDEHAIATPLQAFLDRVRVADGRLHVSFDVDFLDPAIAPAVGTTVPGGATFREAHLVMEMLHDSGLVTSLDVAELNPFLDERGRTARLVVDLVASLFGKSVLDRPNRT